MVLITGGAGGVGRELAMRFAGKNAVVVIWDVNNEGECIVMVYREGRHWVPIWDM